MHFELQLFSVIDKLTDGLEKFETPELAIHKNELSIGILNIAVWLYTAVRNNNNLFDLR